MKLAILLATYNSGFRLKILLNSLFNQSNQNWVLYIHDDLSTDETLDIITRYSHNYPNKIYLMDDDIKKRRGAKNSFFWLLQNINADYYMFCDHDDLWLPNKITISLDRIQELEKKYIHKPICVFTDLAIVDDKYNIIYHSMWKKAKLNPNILKKDEYLKVFNCVTGCTMLFNKKAKEISLPYPNDVPMHDWWIAYKINQKNGILSCINKSTILYCQHNNNVIGAKQIDLSYLIKKITSLGMTYKLNKEKIEFLKQNENYSTYTYIWYKLLYTIYRFFI